MLWSHPSTGTRRTPRTSRRGPRATPGPQGIDPVWTQEALADPDLVALEPDPKSRQGASRFIGESPSAGTVLVVIAYRDLDGELHGINAWPASRADLQIYRSNDEGDDRGEEPRP